MKTNHSYLCFVLAGMAWLATGSDLWAAPLTWFPGPSLYDPVSGAATVFNGAKNILVGGDLAYAPYSYVLGLTATNTYWTSVGYIDSVNIAGGAVVSDGNIVIYGGSDGTASQSAVTAVNLTGDTPPVFPPMTVARSYFGYAPDKNANAYAFGGLDMDGNPLASAERLNPGNNNPAWTAIANLPSAQYDFPAVFNRTNYIYTFGGITDAVSGTETATVLRYSVSGNSWTTLAPLPVAVAGSAATLGPDGLIYVFGGTSGGVVTDLVQVYNPAANSWAISTPLPEPLTEAAAGVDSLGRLIVMGGMDTDGYIVSDVWRSQQLNLPDSVPMFTQFPGTNAAYQVPYVSSITATSSPPPTYELMSGPDGMQVDYYSGAITWTPDASQIGTNEVVIQAANYAGATNWSYELVITNPTPAALTNLAVVGVTEDSVTLSWDPENPVAGPVTYSVYLRHVLHDPHGSGATIWYTQIGSTVTDTLITISGLAAGLSQSYYVVATGSGGTSGYASISATTLPAPPPTNLRVTGLTSTTISLAWDAPVGPVPVVGYQIIGVFNGVFVEYPLSFANIPGTSFTITGLAPGTALLLGVTADDAYGNVSDYDYLPSLVINPTPAAAALTAGIPPSAADGSFQFTAAEGGSILQTVLVQATTNPADAGSWVQIGSVLPAANPFTFTDTNAAQYPVRFYRLLAP